MTRGICTRYYNKEGLQHRFGEPAVISRHNEKSKQFDDFEWWYEDEMYGSSFHDDEDRLPDKLIKKLLYPIDMGLKVTSIPTDQSVATTFEFVEKAYEKNWLSKDKYFEQVIYIALQLDSGLEYLLPPKYLEIFNDRHQIIDNSRDSNEY